MVEGKKKRATLCYYENFLGFCHQECRLTVSSSAERGIMCDKILSPDTLNVDMGDFV